MALRLYIPFALALPVPHKYLLGSVMLLKSSVFVA